MLQEKFDPTINFDLMINFDFFWPVGISSWYEREIWCVDVSWAWKKQKNFDFIDFWFPQSLVSVT